MRTLVLKKIWKKIPRKRSKHWKCFDLSVAAGVNLKLTPATSGTSFLQLVIDLEKASKRSLAIFSDRRFGPIAAGESILQYAPSHKAHSCGLMRGSVLENAFAGSDEKIKTFSRFWSFSRDFFPKSTIHRVPISDWDPSWKTRGATIGDYSPTAL